MLEMTSETSGSSPRAELRTLAAFATVPPAAVCIALVTYEVLREIGRLSGSPPIRSVDSAVSLGMGVGTLAVIVTVFGAVPAVLWFSRHGRLSLRTVLLLGAGLGNVPFAMIVTGLLLANLVSGTPAGDIGRYWSGLAGAMDRTVMGALCGMGSAAVFWAVASSGRGRRPRGRPAQWSESGSR